MTDPQLGSFVDDGAPGHGYFPLMASSPAIDAGGQAPPHQTTPIRNMPSRPTAPRPIKLASHASTCATSAPSNSFPIASRCGWRNSTMTPTSSLSATSSAARDQVALAVTVEGCVQEEPMLQLEGIYLFLREPGCGDLTNGP